MCSSQSSQHTTPTAYSTTGGPPAYFPLNPTPVTTNHASHRVSTDGKNGWIPHHLVLGLAAEPGDPTLPPQASPMRTAWTLGVTAPLWQPSWSPRSPAQPAEPWPLQPLEAVNQLPPGNGLPLQPQCCPLRRDLHSTLPRVPLLTLTPPQNLSQSSRTTFPPGCRLASSRIPHTYFTHLHTLKTW